jgi:ADP-heptose:LPS heptosyltransferase
VFTTCSRHTYLGNFFGKLNDKKYTGILYPDVQNEYEKHSLLIKEITGVNEIEIYNRHFFSFDKNIFYPEYITIAPLSSDKRKQWSIEKYKELADIISQKYNVELIADKKNINNLNYIKSDNPNINFRITNLKELISLINYSSLFIGNDSGPAHIAFKLNKKSIIIIKEEHYNNCFPFDLKNNNVRYITENKNGNITVGDISEILKHLL